MPRFINLAGELIAPPPYRHTEAIQHGLLFATDKGRLQGLVDRTLNRVPHLHFDVVSGHVLLIALFVGSVTTIAPGYEDRGVGSETDIGFWIQVRGGRLGQPPRSHWFPAYLFVDSAGAMAIGREVYGYPKHMGHPQRTNPDDADDLEFSLTTDFFPRYGPTQRPVTATLFAIVRDAGAPPPRAVGGATTAALAAAWDAVCGDVTADFGLPYLAMPMIFVKQFRSIENGFDACYLAAAAVAVRSTRLRSTALIVDRLYLQITPAANIDIAADLGLVSGARPLLAMRLDHDFDVGFGETL